MAITKLMHMKDCGSGQHGTHLKRSIKYILNDEKTQNGNLVGGVNCQPDFAYEQMRATKEKFGKNSKRQGYHFVLSFVKDEVTPELAYEITEKFINEFIGGRYEAVFAVHDNTEHVHSHIVFNSVSFIDGRKYHYKKGDWQSIIQPITNRICKEYGLSCLNLDDEKANRVEAKSGRVREWSDRRDGAFVWSEMIRRDIDACILQADDMESFVALLGEKGYEVKNAFGEGKYITVKPPGMNRFRRCKTLGDDYTNEQILNRIANENMGSYIRNAYEEPEPKLIKCYVKRYRRARLSGIQKKYFRRLYATGKLKKRPYSQAWKYKDDIRKLKQWQEEYLLIEKFNVHSKEELESVVDRLNEHKKEISKEKYRNIKDKKAFEELFDMADKMTELNNAKESFENGDSFFEDEFNEWKTLEAGIREKGYTYEELDNLKNHFDNAIKEQSVMESEIRKQLKVADRITNNSIDTENVESIRTIKYRTEKREKQPVK